VPFWAQPALTRVPSDLTTVHAAFMQGRKTLRLEKGVYEVERVLAPPLGNADDYLFAEPVRFTADRLGRTLTRDKITHPLRLFVSRADIAVRNIVNETELTAELRRLGFTILCPGDYSFRTQLELFASAEIVAGVHGQGLAPIVCARRRRAVMEFEAAGWKFTAYRSLAEVMGIPYHKLPCELIEYRNPGRFDWVARADIGACIAAVEHVLQDVPPADTT
jgi:capsular polysaccharide biosynthesis protein